jgi:hypothetical protein
MEPLWKATVEDLTDSQRQFSQTCDTTHNLSIEIPIPYASTRRSLRGMQEVHSRSAEANVRKRQPHKKMVIAGVSRITSFKVRTLQPNGSCMTETGCCRVGNAACLKLPARGRVISRAEKYTYAATVSSINNLKSRSGFPVSTRPTTKDCRS